MSNFHESAIACFKKLREVHRVVNRLKHKRTELEMALVVIAAKLQDFNAAICDDEDLDRAIVLLDEILSEFKR